jgi:hypothetical protein
MRPIAFLAAILVGSTAFADSVVFNGGNSMDCTVLQERDDSVAILYHSGVLKLSRASIREVVKDAADTTQVSKSRIPDYKAIVVKLAAQDWAAGLQQIPATVVDTGIMRNVPYKSHKAGAAYEINVYGDPAAPAGFEIGVRGGLLTDSAAHRNCVEFVASLLSDVSDKAVVRALKPDKDLVVQKDLTFEITPPTAEDAYGGWWVSVYSEPALNSCRANDKELKAITVSSTSLAESRPAATAVAQTSPANTEQLEAWMPSDLSQSRPVLGSSGGSDAAKTVYVRGYTRKDGTYVHSYTRRSPSR